MKQLLLTIMFLLTSNAYALTDCPSDQSLRFHNCFGTLTYADGGKYVGEWQDDKRHGHGTLTFRDDPSRYEGEWKEDKIHGKGTYFYSNGGKYEGAWKENLKHGQGTEIYPDGGKYEGAWLNDQMHGQGTATFADGNKYVGEWQDANMHGLGTYTYADGTIEGGYHMDSIYVPDICEGMGLTKGTEAFGNCVVELIKKL